MKCYVYGKGYKKYLSHQRRPGSYFAGKKKMGNMELCGFMDQHELVYTNLHACKFIDRWRHELVAGYPNNLSWQLHCVNPDDIEWPRRSKIWNSISSFCKSKFWSSWRQYSCNASCYCRLRMVRYSNMDWWLCYLPDAKALDTFT